MLDSSAVPTDPPTCCMVFTDADATPASPGSTPRVAVLIDVDIAVPSPSPMRISGPRTPLAYVLAASMCESQNNAPAPASSPAKMSGFGPTRGSSVAGTVVDAVTIEATIGRNATPVSTGEKCSDSCREYVRDSDTANMPEASTRI